VAKEQQKKAAPDAAGNTGKTGSGSEAQERIQKEARAPHHSAGVVYVAASFNNTQISHH